MHPRPSPPEPEHIPIPISDGADDQPPQDGKQRQRQRCRSRERVNLHVQVPQEPEFHPVVTPEPDDDISDEDFAIVDSSLPSAEQGNRSRRSERSRSRVRVPPRSSSDTSQQPQPVVPPSGVQQTQATQGEDHDDAATVDPQNRVSDRSRSPQEQEDSRRQGPQALKGKKTGAE